MGRKVTAMHTLYLPLEGYKGGNSDTSEKWNSIRYFSLVDCLQVIFL